MESKIEDFVCSEMYTRYDDTYKYFKIRYNDSVIERVTVTIKTFFSSISG